MNLRLEALHDLGVNYIPTYLDYPDETKDTERKSNKKNILKTPLLQIGNLSCDLLVMFPMAVASCRLGRSPVLVFLVISDS